MVSLEEKEYKPDGWVVEEHSVLVGQLLLEGVHCGVGRMLGWHEGLEVLHHEEEGHEVGVLHEEGVLKDNQCNLTMK